MSQEEEEKRDVEQIAENDAPMSEAEEENPDHESNDDDNNNNNNESTEHNASTEGKKLLAIPLGRVKRILKKDKELRVSNNAAIAIAKATECFIALLANTAVANTKLDKRKVIQYKDVANAVRNESAMDFLSDSIPPQKIAQ
eukprot:comp6357_c0_seq1/m.6133 comp6357_c0_seq1/g.6133  ORF comp6357_c0_seq1/g.6133 comp6357_c0_seq1/m.6133 type:complete len:142 (-) comp6357_c0_seq1:23-448(-)